MVIRARRPRVRRQRKGLITWGSLLSVMFLMMLAAYVSNVAIVVNQKIRTQNAADGTAYSATVWLARGMNSVTATNHVIGEINAMYTMHHALGGKWLDDYGQQRRRNWGDTKVLAWYGGAPYQITKGALYVEYGLLVAAHFVNSIQEWIPFWLPKSGPGPSYTQFNLVRKDPIADINSAIWEGKENLKRHMLIAYGIHLAGTAKYAAGWVKYWKGKALAATVVGFFKGLAMMADGIKMMIDGAKMKRNAKKYEDQIYREYQILDRVENWAINLVWAKKRLPEINGLVHNFQKFTLNVEIPSKSYLTSQEIAKRHNMLKGFALGDFPDDVSLGQIAKLAPSLPIEREKITNETRSQMLRATYPWVKYWRKNIVLALNVVPLSGTSDSYIKWTNKYAYDSSEYLRTASNQRCDNRLTVRNWRSRGRGGMNGKDIRLYVLMDLEEDGKNKGAEKWMQATQSGSKRADELFCSTGFVHSSVPPVITSGFYRQENPVGMVCYSQAMIYNANAQNGPERELEWWERIIFGGNGQEQPHVGWDTLGWDHDRQRVPEWEDPNWFQRLPDRIGFLTEKPPLIKLNWQCKLTPLTTFKMAKTLPTAKALGGEEMSKAIGGVTEIGLQVLLQNH